MGFSGFIQKNLRPAAVAAGGALIAMWGYGSDLWGLWSAGLAPAALQLTGFVVFVVGVISVLYRQHVHLEERLAALPPPGDRAEGRQAPAPAVAVRPKSESGSKRPIAADVEVPPPPTRPDREYVPASVAKAFLASKQGGHTNAQAEALLRPHVGQWIRLRVCLADVSRCGEELNAVVRPAQLTGDHFTVIFSKRWQDPLARISATEMIDLDAQIVDRYRLGLENAELL